ncbi:hypothetical protein PVAND_008734 [Polypedilum vanderplanki]|uniref:Uncharacterized protein n=1 Tax=Polypedilum vanderplanki TaxID=319348 RepID=A0A9J6CBZ5_POLVA|nr:hypothetical protein PVAND_008734 [Polypedilum vanderplanki]
MHSKNSVNANKLISAERVHTREMKLIIWLFFIIFIVLLYHCEMACIINPFDEHSEYDLIDGVVIYPREERCARIGGMCVEKDKCRSLVSANGLCPNNQAKGVECCFELEPQYLPCHQL